MYAVLVHRPPTDQDPDAAILIGLDDTPEPTVTISSGNAAYSGTYSVVLVRGTTGSGTRTVSVLFTQYSNGTEIASQTVSTTYGSLASAPILTVGEVTLPLAAIPADNTATTMSIQIAQTGPTLNGWLDMMLLDTRGQTVLTEHLDSAEFFYIDQPTPDVGIGQVYQAETDRSDAFSVLGKCRISGGPISLDPGDNRLLVYAQNGAPNVAISYQPRWLDERVE